MDVWALGCIFAQLLRRKPLLMGDGSFEILAQISQRLGVPSEETWPVRARAQALPWVSV